MERGLRIGEVAATAGVGTPTLRFYERRGLVKPNTRSASGYRVYSSEQVRTVRFIKRAQRLGFSLQEVRDLLDLRDGARPCRDVRQAAVSKLRDVDAKLRHLKAVQRALKTLVATCGQGKSRSCPILEALGENSERKVS